MFVRLRKIAESIGSQRFGRRTISKGQTLGVEVVWEKIIRKLKSYGQLGLE